MKSILIKNTTREEREQIVAESIGNIDGACDGCAAGLAEMYQEYIDGKEMMKKGYDFRDYVCPDSFEVHPDYFRMGDRYGRALLFRDFASYISDDLVANMTDTRRCMMMSIDIEPVPMNEAIKEAEQRMLGVETNIANFQRKQNMKD